MKPTPWLFLIALLLPPAALPAQSVLLRGGDISMLPKFEELGAQYSDETGPQDALAIMTAHGCNAFRVRLFVAPTGRNAVIQDLNYVIALARRIKRTGAVLLLDLHYSDTWADPAHQSKPAAWADLDFAALAAKVASYTAAVVDAMSRAGCLPDIIQIGNEITPGFLWPDGRIDAEQGGWDRFTTLLKAAIQGAQEPLREGEEIQIMLHVDQGGSFEKTVWFLRNLARYDVAYDLIGLSYYPRWHGDLAALRDNLHRTAAAFGKDVVVVETAYAWHDGGQRRDQSPEARAWPQTPQGQMAFLQDIVAAVRSVPSGRGRGVLWWYPEAIPIRGLKVWEGGRYGLFDAQGRALPALQAFLPAP